MIHPRRLVQIDRVILKGAARDLDALRLGAFAGSAIVRQLDARMPLRGGSVDRISVTVEAGADRNGGETGAADLIGLGIVRALGRDPTGPGVAHG